jgi:hypothetical protein
MIVARPLSLSVAANNSAADAMPSEIHSDRGRPATRRHRSNHHIGSRIDHRHRVAAHVGHIDARAVGAYGNRLRRAADGDRGDHRTRGRIHHGKRSVALVGDIETRARCVQRNTLGHAAHRHVGERSARCGIDHRDVVVLGVGDVGQGPGSIHGDALRPALRRERGDDRFGGCVHHVHAGAPSIHHVRASARAVERDAVRERARRYRVHHGLRRSIDDRGGVGARVDDIGEWCGFDGGGERSSGKENGSMYFTKGRLGERPNCRTLRSYHPCGVSTASIGP